MKRTSIKLFLFGLTLCIAGLFQTQNAAALTVTVVTSGNGHPAHEVQWTDSAGLPRSAVMVDQSANGPGYLYQLTYKVNGSPVVCAGTGITGYPGDGFVENHNTQGSDNNSLDDSTPGTTTVVLSGPSHAIIAYSMPTYQILGVTIPTTIYWFFADGRSHPIFAISQDARATSGNLGANTRSPYGSLNFDGGNGSSDVGGASYGDTLKFVTLAAPPELVTGDSGWKDTQANTIPYAMEWVSTNEGDAEMGHVATLPITVQDQGADRDNNSTLDPRNTQALSGPMIPYGATINSNGDTGPDAWAFQLLDYIFHPDYGQDTQGASDSIQVSYSKLSWGGNFGRVGGYNNGNGALDGTQYSQHYNSSANILTGTRADGMLMAYSVFVVLGTHNGSYTNGNVGQEVIQMQNVTHASLSASAGTVETSGPAGVGNATNRSITYSPVGYDPTYAAWKITATATNTVNATLTPAATFPLDHPIFVIDAYTSGLLPTNIAVGNGFTNAGSDYYATLDTAGQRLWITVNRSVSAALNLVVIPAGGGVPAPIISSIPASGAVGASIMIMGQYFSNATAVAFNGVSTTNFMVDSATQISAVVPVGATTGTITVTTPSGTATSATALTVPGSSYTITLNALPANGGTVSGGGSFPTGSSQMVTATANSGFVFIDWSGDASGTSSPLTVTVNSNMNITANFAAVGTGLTVTVTTNGFGTVSPNLNGKTLIPGHGYSLTATAKTGNVFSNWSGSITTNKNVLTFKAASSLVLQANFITNPFLSLKGTYNGLFFVTNTDVTEQTAGMLKGLAVATKGTYSGTLLINGGSHAFSGAFNLAGQATNKISRPAVQGGNLEVEMTIATSSNSAPQVTGTVFGTNLGVSWEANLTADRATNTVPSAEYTMLILPNTNTAPTNSPGGDGYALITNHLGTATITGALADGTTLNQTVPISQDGYVPMYANLYKSKGLLLGWINLDSINTNGVSLTWINPGRPSGLYVNGFTNILVTNQIMLSPWTNAPGNLGFLTNLSVRDVIDDTNDLASFGITISNNYKLGEVSGSTPLSGTVNPKTGLLKVVIGSGKDKTNGYGAILLNATTGGGYFLIGTSAEAIKLGQ